MRLDDEINDIAKIETQALRLYERLMNRKEPVQSTVVCDGGV